MRTAIGVVFLAFFLASSATITQAQTIQEEGEVVVVSVDSTNLRFSPETVTITEGDSVRFFWSGELLAHNAVDKNGHLLDSKTIQIEETKVYSINLSQLFEKIKVYNFLIDFLPMRV